MGVVILDTWRPHRYGGCDTGPCRTPGGHTGVGVVILDTWRPHRCGGCDTGPCRTPGGHTGVGVVILDPAGHLAATRGCVNTVSLVNENTVLVDEACPRRNSTQNAGECVMVTLCENINHGSGLTARNT